MLSKNIDNMCRIFFNETKNMRKVPMIFDIEIDFESQIFGLFDTSPILKISFGYVHFLANIFLILYPPWKTPQPLLP